MICVNNLTHKYDNNVALDNISFKCYEKECILLVGANGAGKSTLLRILAGKMLHKDDNSVYVLDKHPFRCTTLNMVRSHMDINWGQRNIAFSGNSIPLQSDIKVCDMMSKLQLKYPQRRDELINILKINVNWRMHLVSDGQRRRVQLFLGLIQPFKILLMDEVTISLDALIRYNILKWIKQDCSIRNACCIYTTHIFDGLNEWCDRLIYLNKKGNITYNDKPNFDIYTKFLYWLNSDYNDNENEEINVTNLVYKKNAGGYSHGVLQSLN